MNVACALVLMLFDSLVYFICGVSLNFFNPLLYFIFYVSIAITMLYFYYITTVFGVWLTALNFIINFIAWGIELVLITEQSKGNFLFSEDLQIFTLMLIGAILWAINKTILDIVFDLMGAGGRTISKAEIMIQQLSDRRSQRIRSKILQEKKRYGN